jgi:hypothetical protein
MEQSSMGFPKSEISMIRLAQAIKAIELIGAVAVAVASFVRQERQGAEGCSECHRQHWSGFLRRLLMKGLLAAKTSCSKRLGVALKILPLLPFRRASCCSPNEAVEKVCSFSHRAVNQNKYQGRSKSRRE